jgi:hypothetical protein
VSDTRTYIDNLQSSCLCDAGLPSYIAAVLVAADGRQDLVLVHEELLGDERHTYNYTVPEAAHERVGPLPLEFVRKITISRRTHRCGRPTKSTGAPCRTPVARPGDTCAWHRTIPSERTSQ